ncbi:carbohydrate-binding domain-containing protein [Streptomyces sp. CA-111067]|uniref:carbohydrate-binding domain-containing protein n=1 Tax=Streptomyces sp. CA-111067 TaxID=3240046 RepID=UPI003D97BC92
MAGPTVNVPTTGGWQTWQTVDAGTFQFNAGTYHTVRLEYVKGGLNVNDWQAVAQ